MSIRTSYDYYGPYQQWSAIDDDIYDGAEDGSNVIGYGTSPEEAVADLMRLLSERAGYEQPAE